MATSSRPETPDGATTPRIPDVRRLRRSIASGAVALVAALVTLPDLLFELDRFSPFVQLVSFRPQVVVVLALAMALAAIRAARGRHGWRLAGALAVIVVAGSWMALPRTVAGPGPAPSSGRQLTVATFNTFEGNGDVTAIAELIRSDRPDLVSLVEAGDSYRARLAALVEPLGYRLYATTGPGRPDVRGITAVVSDRLGEVRVRVDDTTEFPSIEVEGGALGRLRFIGFHSMAPTAGELTEWRSDLEQVQRWCSDPTPVIVSGDFNATLDHSVLRSVSSGCRNAADLQGQGLTATWPAWAPPWMGAQIDHVFVKPDIVVTRVAIREIAGSDHRAVVAGLVVPD